MISGNSWKEQNHQDRKLGKAGGFIIKRLSILMQKYVLCLQIKSEHADFSTHQETEHSTCFQISNTWQKLRHGRWSGCCEIRCFVSILFFQPFKGKNLPLCFLPTTVSKSLCCYFGQRGVFLRKPHALLTVAVSCPRAGRWQERALASWAI